LNSFTNKIGIGYTVINYNSINLAVSIKCQLTAEAKITWQKETYEAILKGYHVQLEAYNEQVAAIKAEGTKLLDSNPLFLSRYRTIDIEKKLYLISHRQHQYNFCKKVWFRNV